jgi:hypothetical protein
MTEYTEGDLRDRADSATALAMIAGAALIGNVAVNKTRHIYGLIISNRLATVERLTLTFGGTTKFSMVIPPGGIPSAVPVDSKGYSQGVVIIRDIKTPIISVKGANAGTTPILAVSTADSSIDVTALYYDLP